MSRRTWHSWWPHLLLGALLLVEVGVWRGLHRDAPALRETWRSGTGEERIAAFHVLVNRGEPAAHDFDRRTAEAMLADPDRRIRELVFTNDMQRFPNYGPHLVYLASARNAEPAHWWRAWVIEYTKVGRTRLLKEELGWWLDALEGRAPPMDEAVPHALARETQVLERARGATTEGE